jgi:hypothetical protein
VFYEYDLDQLIAVNKPFGADVKYEYGPPGSPENGVGGMCGWWTTPGSRRAATGSSER